MENKSPLNLSFLARTASKVWPSSLSLNSVNLLKVLPCKSFERNRTAQGEDNERAPLLEHLPNCKELRDNGMSPKTAGVKLTCGLHQPRTEEEDHELVVEVIPASDLSASRKRRIS